MILLNSQDLFPEDKLAKVLIAEDEPELLKAFKLLLQNEGYQAVTAKDGQECIDLYKNELKKRATENSPPFDMVLLDYRMPKKNGAEVAIEILALCPTQKLMMVTAFSGVNELIDVKLRKIHVMPKPFDFDDLFSAISTELKKAQ